MTIQELETRLITVEQMVMELQRNSYPMVNKVDATSNKVDVITPYTDTETAYIGDDDVHFFDVPQGMLSVSAVDSNGNYLDYTVEREGSHIAVYFDEPLENVATVTIMIQ